MISSLSTGHFFEVLRAIAAGSMGMLAVSVLVKRVPGLSANIRAWLWRLVGLKFAVALFALAPVAILPRGKPLTPPSLALSFGVPNAQSAISEKTEGRTSGTGQPYVQPLRSSLGSTVNPGDALEILWLIGAVGVWTRMMLQLLLLHLYRDQVCEVATERSDIQLELGHRVQVVVAPGVVTPMLLDGLAPVVVLPEGLTGIEREAAIAHEWAHHQRRDAAWGLILRATAGLFWFFPPIWWVVRSAALAAEEACDQSALRTTGIKPAEYAALLVRCSANSRGSAAALALSSHATSLAHRIHAMSPKSRSSHSFSLLLAVCPICAIGLVPWIAVAKPPPIQNGSPITRKPDEAQLIKTYANGCASLMGDPDVQAEIGLTAEQKRRLEKIGEAFTVRIHWLGARLAELAAHNASDNDRNAFDLKYRPDIFGEYARQRMDVLTAVQRARIHEIALQVFGPRCVAYPEVQEELGLSPDKRRYIADIEADYYRQVEQRVALSVQNTYPRPLQDMARLTKSERVRLSQISAELPAVAGDRRRYLLHERDRLVEKTISWKHASEKLAEANKAARLIQDSMSPFIRQCRQREGQRIWDRLTPEERNKFESMKGAPFKFKHASVFNA